MAKQSKQIIVEAFVIFLLAASLFWGIAFAQGEADKLPESKSSTEQQDNVDLLRQAINLLGKVDKDFLQQKLGVSVVEEATTKPAAIKPSLEQLSNAELMRQASELLGQKESDFLEKKRGVFITDAQYRQTQLERRNFKLLAVDTQKQLVIAEENSQAQAKQQFTADQSYQQSMQQFHVSIEQEAALLQKKISLSEAAQDAGDELLAIIKQLAITHLLEMDLRYQDGTLARDDVLPSLRKTHIEQLEQKIPSVQADLRIMMLADMTQLKALKAYKKQVNRALENAKSKLEASQQIYEQVTQQQAFENKYAGKTAREMQVLLDKLQKERIWLQGSLNLSLHKFLLGEQQAQAAQQALDNMRDVQEPPVNAESLGAEEAVHLAEQTQEAIRYHRQRLNHLNTWHIAIKSMADLGESLQADLKLQGNQLLVMRFLAQKLAGLQGGKTQQGRAEVLESGSTEIVSEGSEQYAVLEKRLEQALSQNNQQLLDVAKQSKMNQQQGSEIAKQAADAKQNVARYQDLLTDVEKMVGILQKTERYSKQLAALDAQQVIQRFTSNDQALSDAKDVQASLHKVMQKMVLAAKSAKDKLYSLKDPLMRADEAKAFAAGEKANMLKSLYQLAKLNTPEHLEAATDVAADVGAAVEPKDLHEKIQFYSNLLTNRVRILESRETQRRALLEALRDQKMAQEKYIEQFSIIQQLLLERYATAVELRKRLGQGELEGSTVPEGTTAALQRADLGKIDDERAEFIRALHQTQHDLAHYEQLGGLQTDVVQGLSDVQTVGSKRLDLLHDVDLLAASLQDRIKQQTEAEEKTQQQTALRRMEAEATPYEMVLSFMPSESAEAIEELLHSYYVELMQLEDQYQNLDKQTEHTMELVKLVEDEIKRIEQLIPVLSKHLAEQTQHRDALLTLVQAQLVEHEEADKILNKYFEKTGERLKEPHPLPKEEKRDAIEAAAEILFEWHVQLSATKEWINLLKQRAGIAGLGEESSYYNDSLAKLNSQQSSIQRRMGNLTGHSEQELAALAEIDRPKNAEEERAFLLGGIGIARENLSDLRTQGAVAVAIHIASIILVMLILLWVVAHFIHRTTQRLQETEPDNQHMMLAWAAIHSLIRMAIIVTAFVMILSSFGIEVGAILAGLGIGGLAVAMAAKDSLANILAGVTIFLEKPFKVGDEIQIGDSEVAKVEGIGWRSTCVVTQFGYTISIPNSQASEMTVINFTKKTVTGDYVSVLVPQAYNPDEVVKLLDKALDACPSIKKNDDKGTLVVGLKIIYEKAWMEYQPCWYTDDYHNRDQERKEVWSQIWCVFNEAGIKFEIGKAEEKLGVSSAVADAGKLLGKL